MLSLWPRGQRPTIHKSGERVVTRDIMLRSSWGLLLALPPALHAALTTVTLDYGIFNGLAGDTQGIVYFRGVRYADPPVGELRWRAPVTPPTSHIGTVDASQFGSTCIANTQTSTTPTTSEDCLFANVYIPINTTEKSALPVLVYFHGGGFEVGSSRDAPPENIIQGSATPLIFVTFEYRLGQFGFLGGEAVKMNGDLNVGLLDQVSFSAALLGMRVNIAKKAGLEWLQRYIHKFGGDPKRVTIWGESAGAGSTMFQLIGNGGKNANLFRAAMGDSPSLNFAPDYNSDFVQGLFSQFVGFAGCSDLNSAQTMSCLRALPVNTIALAGSRVNANRTATLYPFAPYFDGVFVQQRPVEAFKSGRFARVPILFGSNTNEGAHWSSELPDPNANTSNPNANQKTVFNFLKGQYTTLSETSFEKALSQFYPLSDYGGSFSLQGQQMYGEMRYICTAVMIAGAAHDFGLEAYQYHWDNPTLSSDHGADLNAFFKGTQVFDPDDQALVIAMRQWFTSFAVLQKPVANDAIKWVRATDATGSPRILLHPGAVALENVTSTLRSRCDFWHSLHKEIST
ncbi:Carboxylic ester hydrolase [Mycena indigotica]|uniref:Carboxylic ester hydrolase n=1 Tax=Mycena indigotica TaxID=2126181 RepID=A0A8H6SLR1_9AGAR|nr:Carboxylic ester hydrolase [Mycena indigotica]KAF7300956.1 Carboxylic ester hydrolase [Mycena indigotica]